MPPWVLPTAAQIDALQACDVARGTGEQCRAFETVFELAMKGYPVDGELLALALTIPRRLAAEPGSGG